MKKARLIAVLLLLVVSGGLLCAQTSVAMLETDGKMTYFSVEVATTKSGDQVPTAIRELFATLLDNGVENFLDGKPMMQIKNPKWKANFFKAKNPPYMAYVKGVQVEKKAQETAGGYKGNVLIMVNTDFLIRQLKTFGVMKK